MARPRLAKGVTGGDVWGLREALLARGRWESSQGLCVCHCTDPGLVVCLARQGSAGTAAAGAGCRGRTVALTFPLSEKEAMAGAGGGLEGVV